MTTAQAEHNAPWQSMPRGSESQRGAEKGGFKAKLESTKASLEQYAVFRILLSTAEGFQKDRVPNQAAAMTYYGIFSLFPLILLFVAMAGLALQSSEAAREQIMGVITGLLPQGQDQLGQVIGSVIDAKGVAAGIGLLTLLWSALGWFQVIDNNINQIWGVGKPRSFIKGKLFALTMVAAIGGVALVSFAATAAVNLLATFTNVIPGSIVLWQAVISLLSVLTIAAGFYVLYRYAPQREQQFADIWPAALATALLWEITRRALAFYLEKNNMISGYGPIGAAMALLFWIYVASMIILIGAELAYAIAKERRHIAPEDEMKVVADPGEQPTPKFAPQVGSGTGDRGEKEPIESSGASTTGVQAGGPGDVGRASPALGDGRRSGTPSQQARSPSAGSSVSDPGSSDGIVKTLLWTGLTAGAVALGGVLARRVSSTLWEKAAGEPPPSGKV